MESNLGHIYTRSAEKWNKNLEFLDLDFCIVQPKLFCQPCDAGFGLTLKESPVKMAVSDEAMAESNWQVRTRSVTGLLELAPSLSLG